MTTYTTGTVNITNGSTSVVGISTLWSLNISAGMYLKIANIPHYYLISSVNSDTSITISDIYLESSVINTSYFITNASLLTIPTSGDNGGLIDGSPVPDETDESQSSTKFAKINHVHPTDTSRASINSPIFMGIPRAPTPTVDTNTTQLATTEFVLGQAATDEPMVNGISKIGTSTLYARQDHVHPIDTSRAAVDSPIFTGVPSAPTADTNSNTAQIATTAYVAGQASTTAPIIDGKATIGSSILYAREDHVHPTDTSRAAVDSPKFNGIPEAPTAAAGTKTTQIATTEFVLGQGANVEPIMDGAVAIGTSTLYAREDHVHPTDTSRASLVSPIFAGTPSAPTAPIGTNTTQIATTEFVLANGGGRVFPATIDPLIDGNAEVGTSELYAREDHVHPTDTSRASVDSPIFTGIPSAPTPAITDNTTQIATMAALTASSIRNDRSQKLDTAQQIQAKINIGTIGTGVITKTSDYMITAIDIGKTIQVNGSFILSFDTATNLGNGFLIFLKNTGLLPVVLTPNSKETLDKTSKQMLLGGQSMWIFSDGVSLTTNNWIKNPVVACVDVASSIASFDMALPIGYKSFEIIGDGIAFDADLKSFYMRTSIDGGNTFNSTSEYTIMSMYTDSTTVSRASVAYTPSFSSFKIASLVQNTNVVPLGFHGVFFPSNMNGANPTLRISNIHGAKTFTMENITGMHPYHGVVNALRFFITSGNITRGSVTITGVSI